MKNFLRSVFSNSEEPALTPVDTELFFAEAGSIRAAILKLLFFPRTSTLIGSGNYAVSCEIFRARLRCR